jgi:hypothetical protein
MNASLSTIDIKLATLIYSGLDKLKINTYDYYTGIFMTGGRKLTNELLMGSRKAAAFLHPEEYCCAACKRNSLNRYKRSRIYKTDKRRRVTDKVAIAESLQIVTKYVEPEVIHEVLDSFIESNLICGCEVTILENGEKYVCRCNTEECVGKNDFYRHTL